MKLPPVAPAGPVMVHTDIFRVRSLAQPARDRETILAAHEGVVENLADGRQVWFPAFNYDFLSGGYFRPDADRAQVGALNEHVRTHPGSWRTTTPVFSFTGTGPPPAPQQRQPPDIVDPFGSDSTFAKLVEADGSVVWYGAPISSSTILHHAESRAGGPAYRFDKFFRGTLQQGDRETQVTLKYHVRPLDRHLEYDWPRLTSAARAAHVIQDVGGAPFVHWASARELVHHWLDQLKSNPLALLDQESREWIRPELERLGRRFQREDFEGDRS